MWVLEDYDELDSIILSDILENEITIKKISELIAEEYNYSDHIIYDTTYTDGQYKKTADNSKLIGLIGNFKFTPIKDGIRKSVLWFNKNIDTCRK